MNKQLNNLPYFLQQEWKHCYIGFWSPLTIEENFNNFIELYDTSIPIIKDICNTINKEVIFEEWYYYKYNINRKYKLKTIEEIELLYEKFKKYWDINNNLDLFDEMSKLSDNLLTEWRYKYTYFYPEVYEKSFPKHKKEKSKKQLWCEFKEIWELDYSDYNEDKLNEILEDLHDGLHKEYNYDVWRSYLTNSNYHSYDSYSILERCDIWDYFVSHYDSIISSLLR